MAGESSRILRQTDGRAFDYLGRKPEKLSHVKENKKV